MTESGNCHFMLLLMVGEHILANLGAILIPCYHCYHKLYQRIVDWAKVFCDVYMCGVLIFLRFCLSHWDFVISLHPDLILADRSEFQGICCSELKKNVNAIEIF